MRKSRHIISVDATCYLVSLSSIRCIAIMIMLWIGPTLTSSSGDWKNNNDNRNHEILCPKQCLDNQSKYNNNHYDTYHYVSNTNYYAYGTSNVRSAQNRRIMTETEETMNNRTTKPSNMTRIFYLILIHNERTANDAIYLFRSIRHPNNIVLFHIDSKAMDRLKPPSQLLLYPSTTETTTRNSSNNNMSSSESEAPSSSLLWDELLYCPCGSKVRIVSKYSITWGHWNMTEPTLCGIEIATSSLFWGSWDVFINLSGDTLPVYTPNAMENKLRDLYPYNFVTSSSCETSLIPTNVYDFPKWFHKRKHYTREETEPDPIFTYTDTDNNIQRNITITTYFGSQWVILQSSFCLWLHQQLQIQNSWVNQYRLHLIQSQKLMSDETFIPTILMSSPLFHDAVPKLVGGTKSNFIRHRNYYHKNKNRDNDEENDDGLLIYPNGTISNIYHVRYERMDEHMPSAYGYFATQQRYDVSSSVKDIVDVPRVWGPYYLGIYDLGNIKYSGALFIRKISSMVDSNMISLLPVDHIDQIPDIYWPIHEVQLSAKPGWEQKLHDMIMKQQQKQTKKHQANKSNDKGDMEDEEEDSGTNQEEDPYNEDELVEGTSEEEDVKRNNETSNSFDDQTYGNVTRQTQEDNDLEL